jgi:hypothetical protein
MLIDTITNRGSTILKDTSTQAVLILCGDVCYLAYALMIVYYLSWLAVNLNQGLACLPMELEQVKRLQSYSG